MWPVQALLFADLGKDLGRAQRVAPLVETKSIKEEYIETRSIQVSLHHRILNVDFIPSAQRQLSEEQASERSLKGTLS